jgi:hypothetical protein
MGTGFEGDRRNVGEQLPLLYLGTVIERQDPDDRGRVRVRIPGVMERSPWAIPRGGGSSNEGAVSVPPLNADVFVQFVNGDPDVPVYERADFGVVNEQNETFPEHTDPDIHVFGIGPFRIVVDNRTGEDADSRTVRAKLVKTVVTSGNVTEEQDIAWIEISEENSIHIYASSAVGIEAGAIVDIDAPTVQVKKRKVGSTTRPIN